VVTVNEVDPEDRALGKARCKTSSLTEPMGVAPEELLHITRAPAANPAPARFSTTIGNNVGGMAR
jgi:hypothetical protein